jgi:hypothetical protein
LVKPKKENDSITLPLFWVPWDALTKYQRLGALNNRNLFSDRMSKICARPADVFLHPLSLRSLSSRGIPDVSWCPDVLFSQGWQSLESGIVLRASFKLTLGMPCFQTQSNTEVLGVRAST